MKLIDFSKMIPCKGINFIDQYVLHADRVDAATVDAIPVEWIEQKIKTVCDNFEAEMFGKWLIKQWREENEID